VKPGIWRGGGLSERRRVNRESKEDLHNKGLGKTAGKMTLTGGRKSRNLKVKGEKKIGGGE